MTTVRGEGGAAMLFRIPSSIAKLKAMNVCVCGGGGAVMLFKKLCLNLNCNDQPVSLFRMLSLLIYCIAKPEAEQI